LVLLLCIVDEICQNINNIEEKKHYMIFIYVYEEGRYKKRDCSDMI